MDGFWQPLQRFAERPWSASTEIGLLAVVIYYVHHYFRGTRGGRVLAGLTFSVVGLALLSEGLNLIVFRWLIERCAVSLPVVVAVIFQPELRRLFADLGSRSLPSSRKRGARSLDALCGSVFEMASRHCGALIAIERGIGLRTYAETGVAIDAAFSSELIQTIFQPKTALHDGGVILRGERIAAAACIFPVTQRESLDRSFGLRHRAGLGLCEETDAVAIVVSEETGSVSLCFDHSVKRGLTRGELRLRLGKILLGSSVRPSEAPEEQRAPLDDEREMENV